jgi:hypothetical protein
MISAMWLLCMCVTVALPMPRRVAGYVALAGGCIVVLALAQWLPPSPGGIGLLAGMAAIWQLLRPSTGLLSNALAGCLTGCAAWLHVDLGAPLPAAAAPALALALLAAWRAQADPQFAPGAMRRQALLAAALVAPAFAAWPGVREGWQSAQALNQNLQDGPATAMPAWVWPLAGLALAIGIVHGMVRR